MCINFFIATIISTTDQIQPSYKKKRFSTYNNEIKSFISWLKANDCYDVCLESTGKYLVPVFNILEDNSIRVTIANPKLVRAVKGNKDDVKASKWIGTYFVLDWLKVALFLQNLLGFCENLLAITENLYL